jgi:hypothetical protein
VTKTEQIGSSFGTALLEEAVLEVGQVTAFQAAKCCLVTLAQLLPNLERALAPREQQTTASGLSMQLSVQLVAVAPCCRARGM